MLISFTSLSRRVCHFKNKVNLSAPIYSPESYLTVMGYIETPGNMNSILFDLKFTVSSTIYRAKFTHALFQNGYIWNKKGQILVQIPTNDMRGVLRLRTVCPNSFTQSKLSMLNLQAIHKIHGAIIM